MVRRHESKGGKKGDGNEPTHYLKMKPTDPDSSGWSRVGAAWVSKATGSISIKLNRGVVLDWHDFPDNADHTLILVPVD